jgi:hypothetical protein
MFLDAIMGDHFANHIRPAPELLAGCHVRLPGRSKSMRRVNATTVERVEHGGIERGAFQTPSWSAATCCESALKWLFPGH